MLGARTSPSPGSADLVTPHASPKPPIWPWHSCLWLKPSLVPSSRGCSNFHWLFSGRPEPPAGGLSPWLVQTQPGAPRGSNAALTPHLAALCPRSRRTTALAITSEGQKFLFIARIPSGPAKPAWLGQARPQGTAASSQPLWSCLSLSAYGDRTCPTAPGFTPNSAEPFNVPSPAQERQRALRHSPTLRCYYPQCSCAGGMKEEEEEGAGQVSGSCFPLGSPREEPPPPRAVCRDWRPWGGWRLWGVCSPPRGKPGPLCPRALRRRTCSPGCANSSPHCWPGGTRGTACRSGRRPQ